MNITTLGIDLAKNVFQLYGTDKNDKPVLKKRVKRNELIKIMANLPKCKIGMEACGGSHYWGREFEKLGHQVKLMPPQYVKPYVKRDKTDSADAEACNEAANRPNMRFVAIKTVEQQTIQSLHAIRSSLIGRRTQIMNQVRGLLAEYGIVSAKGHAAFKKLCEGLVDHTNHLSPILIEALQALYKDYQELNLRIEAYKKQFEELAPHQSAHYEKIKAVPGFGPISTSAFLCHVGDGKQFKKGRFLASHLGVVPRENSSGESRQLGGISKRGNRYLRTLLVHGARAVVSNAKDKTDPYSLWIQQLLARKHFNEVVIAVVNKNVRIAWAILQNGQAYDANKASDFITGSLQLSEQIKAA